MLLSGPVLGCSLPRRSWGKMWALTSLARHQREVASLATRAFATAAHDVAVPASSPFLRFSNPYPTAIDHTPLLSTIPETQVRAGLRAASRQPCRCS